MKNNLIKIIGMVGFMFASLNGKSQALSYSDQAVAYNRLLVEKNSNTYVRIGNYKVTGTPYLFGENEAGNLYGTSGKLENVKIRYNTYTQEVEGLGETGTEKVRIEFTNIDSFSFNRNGKVHDEVHFIRTAFIDSTAKDFMMVMYVGKTYSLYKKYKSVLAMSTTNIGQVDLRQFELEFDYYYTGPGFYGLKKIKTNDSFLKKTFNDKINMDQFIDQHDKKKRINEFMVELFEALNK